MIIDPYALSVGEERACGAARAEGCDTVIAALIRSKRIGRTHGNDRGLVAGAVDRAVELLSGGVLSVVSGCSNHDYTRIYQSSSGSAQRVVAICFHRSGAQTKVDDLDILRNTVGIDPIQSLDQKGR